MRILFIAPEVPWPTCKGDRQRSFALLRALASRHEVTLTVPATVDEANTCREGLGKRIARFLPVPPEFAFRGKIPDSAWKPGRLVPYVWDLLTDQIPFGFRYINDNYSTMIRSYYGEFDAVFCRYLRMLPVVRDFPNERIVVDADDLNYLGLLRSSFQMSHGWSSPMQLPEACRSYCFEQRMFKKLARVLVCSEQDLARVRTDRKEVVRNGIDKPDPVLLHTLPRQETLVFVGQMTYGPNTEGLRWFVESVWPFVRRTVPNARLRVIGRGASSETIPFTLPEGVDLIGEVEETASWFSSAVLSVAPLRVGMGTRIKILESLACGRSVVSTTVGAEGLDDLDERAGLFRADDPRMMADRISGLLRHPELALQHGRRGQVHVESHYTWNVTTQSLATEMERWIPRKNKRSYMLSCM